MRLRLENLGLVTLVSAALGGCAPSSRIELAALNPQLALVGEELAAVADDATDARLADVGRNDGLLGSTPGVGMQSIQYVRVRHREFLRSSNGRPREYSSTYTHAIKQSVVR
jgi:hypothetical protein